MAVRLDLFLKNSGLFKQRAAARRACGAGQVLVDGRPARASREIRVGERVCITSEEGYLEAEILAIPARPVSRGERGRYCRIVRSERRAPDPETEEVFGFDEELRP